MLWSLWGFIGAIATCRQLHLWTALCNLDAHLARVPAWNTDEEQDTKEEQDEQNDRQRVALPALLAYWALGIVAGLAVVTS